jgi:hypothetical protein
MDLGAFLEPGLYPVFFMDSNNKLEPWGHIFHREGRSPSWITPFRHVEDCVLTLSLELCDFTCANDGALVTALGEKASLNLVGEVGACRAFVKDEIFVLRFRSLVRLMDMDD